ncbi:type II secretion system F family protein [Polynucleobacter sp. MG-6-Vaara-E2]|uniref:type II secretion system F family protein n=1 Tax=Polynucleobacter sp. MG-6-Vaara-E2 TaxID=2576932 RepID=UPI001BFE57F9|nr:type II secretion system F family protein [Polynucleobacter sp. MG-6-Vaara-E2]QWD95957.1 type II secretion system F family protein [Polynucleobacter sp. MG-6-Vaara-E2]
MRNFTYQAKDRVRKKIKGSFQAESMTKARVLLRNKGLSEITIKELRPARSSASLRGAKNKTSFNFAFSFFNSISPLVLLVFSKKLATMIRSGLPILDSLILIQSQTENKAFAKALQDIINSVNSGVSFSAALAKYPRYFDEVYRNMIEAGEVTGKLDIFLDRLVEGLERMQTIRSGIKSALFYPMTLVLVTLAISAFMMIKVVPTFVGIYGNMGVKLPGPTQVIMDISAWMLDGWNMLALMIGLLLTYAANGILNKYSFLYKRAISTILLKLPIFGNIIIKASIARMSLLMANLFVAGISIDEIMRIASRTTKNILFVGAMQRISKEIVTGKELSTLFEQETVFPLELSQLVKVGEKTGRMDEMLTSIAKYYLEEFETVVKGLTTVIEPLMIVFIGLVIGMLVIALYLPIFNAGDAVG